MGLLIVAASITVLALSAEGFCPHQHLGGIKRLTSSPSPSLLRESIGDPDDRITNTNSEETAPRKQSPKPPPLLVEDFNLLSGDIFLLVLLSITSFWSYYHASLEYLTLALNEASLLCILWIVAGLANGAFLYSAVDGHYKSGDEKGGPVAAGMLGLNTSFFVGNLRVILAILVYKIGLGEPEKELIILEIGSLIALMSSWRMLHSRTTPRI